MQLTSVSTVNDNGPFSKAVPPVYGEAVTAKHLEGRLLYLLKDHCWLALITIERGSVIANLYRAEIVPYPAADKSIIATNAINEYLQEANVEEVDGKFKLKNVLYDRLDLLIDLQEGSVCFNCNTKTVPVSYIGGYPRINSGSFVVFSNDNPLYPIGAWTSTIQILRTGNLIYRTLPVAYENSTPYGLLFAEQLVEEMYVYGSPNYTSTPLLSKMGLPNNTLGSIHELYDTSRMKAFVMKVHKKNGFFGGSPGDADVGDTSSETDGVFDSEPGFLVLDEKYIREEKFGIRAVSVKELLTLSNIHINDVVAITDIQSFFAFGVPVISGYIAKTGIILTLGQEEFGEIGLDDVVKMTGIPADLFDCISYGWR